MWPSSSTPRRNRAPSLLLCLGALTLHCAGAGVTGRAGLEVPSAPQPQATPLLEGLVPPTDDDAATRAAHASSVLRCFQAGHLVYEGYNLHVNHHDTPTLELSAQPAGKVQLLDLQDGLCVLENRLP